MKRQELIALLICSVFLAFYLLLDLADAAKPLTQLALSPVMLVCTIFRLIPVARFLDVDTAGAAHTAARLFAFAAVQAWLAVPIIVHGRVRSRSTAVLKWSALGIAAMGFGYGLFWFLILRLM